MIKIGLVLSLAVPLAFSRCEKIEKPIEEFNGYKVISKTEPYKIMSFDREGLVLEERTWKKGGFTKGIYSFRINDNEVYEQTSSLGDSGRTEYQAKKADINKDKIPDLVLFKKNSGEYYFLINNGLGSFTMPITDRLIIRNIEKYFNQEIGEKDLLKVGPTI